MSKSSAIGFGADFLAKNGGFITTKVLGAAFGIETSGLKYEIDVDVTGEVNVGTSGTDLENLSKVLADR